jgi:uncharacterized protein (TIGR03089 family)
VRGLTAWTAGLVGERDPAQPLLTLYAGGGRVELSGATTANWVAKTANLLVDGLGSPQRVGLLLPLHWQSLCLLMASVTTGATAVVAAEVEDLAGCDAAFVEAARASAALDQGVDEVLALSGHPFGGPLPAVPPLPAMVQDYAREVPAYGDSWSGAAPSRASVEVAGAPLRELPSLGLSAADRVLVRVSLSDPDSLPALLAVLRSGASVVLVPGDEVDLAATADAERATAALGVVVAGCRRLAV